MGLFGLGKKKTSESETDKVFKQFGSETNELKSPANQTRKQAVANARDERTSQQKKDQILERLASLRKSMYSNPAFDRDVNRLEDEIVKLKNMADNVNKNAMGVVDNFILNTANDAINSCNRGNFVAVGAYVDLISNYINDRFQCSDYYTDPTFCKFKLERNRLYVESCNLDAVSAKLQSRGRELLADYKNPAMASYQRSIFSELNRIKEELGRLESQKNNIEAQTKIIDKAINEIETHSRTHGNDNVFNLQDELDDVVALKRENEMDESSFDKMNDLISTSHRHVSANTLNVNDDVCNADSADTDINIDDLFNF